MLKKYKFILIILTLGNCSNYLTTPTWKHFVTLKTSSELSTHVPGFKRKNDLLEQITIGMKFVHVDPFSVKFFVVDENTVDTNYMQMARITFIPDANETDKLLNIIEYNADFEFCQSGCTLPNIIDNQLILDDCSVLIYHLGDLRQNTLGCIDFAKEVGNPRHEFNPQILRILHEIENRNDPDNLRLKLLLRPVISGKFLDCADKCALAANFNRYHRPIGLIRKPWSQVTADQ